MFALWILLPGFAMTMARFCSDVGGCGIFDPMHKVIAALYDAAFQLPLTQFQDFAFEQVGQLVPHDSGVWATGNHATNQIHAVHLVNQKPDFLVRYGMNYADTDLVRARAIAEPGRSFRIEDVMTLADYRALPVYSELVQEVGIEHSIGTAQTDAFSGISDLILLWRADRGRPFSEAERQTKQDIVPHMITAWRHRQLIGDVNLASVDDESHSLRRRAHAIVDAEGMIYAVIGSFSALLAEAVPDWIGPNLPGILIQAMSAGQTFVAIGGHEFAFSFLETRTLVTIIPTIGASKLSHGELRTALLFAGGASNKQIAADIGLSTFTVRNQISSAYRKLGVHSKFELTEAIKNRR